MLFWTPIALLLVAPYVVTLWARRRALAAGVPGWFGYLQTVQWTAIAYTGCWPAAYSALGLAIVPWLARHGLAAWTTPAAIATIGVPLVAFQMFAAVSIQTVNRATRGSEVSGDEVMGDQVRALAGLAVVFAAMCGGLVAMTIGHWRLALGVMLAGILLGTMFGATRRPRAAPLAITHGELRDRLFAWAERAGVRVRQLYVVPFSRTRIANAVAVQGQSVMVTDNLLAHLGRDEVDAVLAHELAHLKHRHPLGLAITLVVSGMGAWWTYSVSSVAGPFAYVAAILVFMAVSRRFEYAADAGALALGIKPEAFISGLARVARVNHFPQDWSRLREWTLTHPSNRRRAIHIGKRAGIPLERIEALLNDPTEVGDHDAVPAQVREDRVFTTSFKGGVLQRNGWAMLFANAAIAAALARSIGWSGILDGLGALRFVPIGALTFVAAFLLIQHLGMRPYRALRATLWHRRQGGRPGAGEPSPLWVGLSPGSESRLYEGFLTWDVGFLALGPERLEYRGEETGFSLARHEITSIAFGARFPAWVPVFGVTLAWRNDERQGRFTVLPIQAAGLISYAREARRLRDRLERWHARVDDPAGAASFPTLPIESGAPPTGTVTGTPPAEALKPAALIVTVIFQLAIAAGVAAVVGLHVWPRRGLGLWDAVLASLLSYFLLITPLLGARFQKPAAVERDDREIRKAA